MKFDSSRNAIELRQISDWIVLLTIGWLAAVSCGVPLFLAIGGALLFIRPWEQKPEGQLWKNRNLQLVFWTLAFLWLLSNWPGYSAGVAAGHDAAQSAETR